MAGRTIVVDVDLFYLAALLIQRRGITYFGGAVIMLVVPDMVDSCACLVLAIAGHRCPRHLERKPNQQEDTQEASHGGAVYGYVKALEKPRSDRVIIERPVTCSLASGCPDYD